MVNEFAMVWLIRAGVSKQRKSYTYTKDNGERMLIANKYLLSALLR